MGGTEDMEETETVLMASQMAMRNTSPLKGGVEDMRRESPWLKLPWGACRPLQEGSEDKGAGTGASPHGFSRGHEEHAPPPSVRGGKEAEGPLAPSGLWPDEMRPTTGRREGRASARDPETTQRSATTEARAPKLGRLRAEAGCKQASAPHCDVTQRGQHRGGS